MTSNSTLHDLQAALSTLPGDHEYYKKTKISPFVHEMSLKDAIIYLTDTITYTKELYSECVATRKTVLSGPDASSIPTEPGDDYGPVCFRPLYTQWLEACIHVFMHIETLVLNSATE